MSVPTLKPTDGLIPEILKLLKAGFDDPKLNEYEPGLYRAALLSTRPEVVVWRGEILHQLALRAERRGDIKRAMRLYQLAIDTLRDSTLLGEARCLRDLGIRTALIGNPSDGVELVRDAYQLHESDLQEAATNAQEIKAERQLRIGHGYLLRARIVAEDDRRSALEELIDLAITESRSFNLRDQQILVNFTIGHARGGAKRELRRRQLELNVKRHKPIGTVTSLARVTVDTHLHITGHMLGSIVRKEWSLPRPS